MSTTIGPRAVGSGAAPAREQAAVASASQAGEARGSAPPSDNHLVVFGAQLQSLLGTASVGSMVAE
jgi:hypothetical protein